ncbi:MAG: PorP/SprF family type IX secretion system membrane protein [Bacteroidota bacterium]
MKILRLTLAALAISSLALAQDFHYSQFIYSPSTLNPANTGAFNGDIRVTNNYRQQWSSITSFPYKTLTMALDAPIFRSKMKGDDYFAGGISVSNDKAGASKLTGNLYSGAICFNKSLSQGGTKYISIGFQTGYGMRSIDLSALSWDNQWSGGTYNSSLPSGEPTIGLTKNYLDMSTGILFSSIGEMVKWNIGAAMFHVNQPDIGFGTKDRLYAKYVAHGSGTFRLGKTSNTSLIPGLHIAVQGPTTLVNTGMAVKYVLQDRSKYTGYYSEMSVQFGGWYRMGDALIFSTRFDYGQFAAGFSYDMNLSGLTAASNGKGGFELLFQYNGVFGGATVKTVKSRI